VEPFVTAAVRVNVQRGPGLSANIDWPAANELLRQLEEPAASGDTATVWRDAFAIASRHLPWVRVPVRSPSPPAWAPPAPTEPTSAADDTGYVEIASGARATRKAIQDALRRWARGRSAHPTSSRWSVLERRSSTVAWSSGPK
jgi:hypothetical protein